MIKDRNYQIGEEKINAYTDYPEESFIDECEEKEYWDAVTRVESVRFRERFMKQKTYHY